MKIDSIACSILSKAEMTSGLESFFCGSGVTEINCLECSILSEAEASSRVLSFS